MALCITPLSPQVQNLYILCTYIWVKTQCHWAIARLSCQTLHSTLAYLIEVPLNCRLEEATMILALIT